MKNQNLAPHVMFHCEAFSANICKYCGLSEEYLLKGSLEGGWPHGGRYETRDGEWAMVCKYWPAFADKINEIEAQLKFQSGLK